MAFSNKTEGIASFQTDQTEMSETCLDIYSPPIVENELLEGKDLQIYPNQSITDEGPYEFIIQSSGEEYLHMPSTRLHMCFSIQKLGEDGVLASAGNSEDYSVVNLTGNSLFKQIEVTVCNTPVVDQSTTTYSYKALLDTLLSYGREAKSTHLKTAMFYKDGAGTEDKNEFVAPDTQSGYVLRKKSVKNSKRCHITTQLHCDFMNCPRLLLPGCNVKILLSRQSDDFCLLTKDTAKKYKIKIHELKLSLRKVKVSPVRLKMHMDQIQTTDALYPFRQTRITTHLLANGTPSKNIEDLVRGPLPQQIFCCMVDAANYTGSPTTNPFQFQNFGLNSWVFKVNGVNNPTSAFQPDFAADNYFREYQNLMDCIGVAKENGGVDFNPSEFKNGNMILAYDSSADRCNSYHTHTLKTGVIGAELAFKTPLVKPVQLIVYSVYHMMLKVDKDRNAKMDYVV